MRSYACFLLFKSSVFEIFSFMRHDGDFFFTFGQLGHFFFGFCHDSCGIFSSFSAIYTPFPSLVRFYGSRAAIGWRSA